MKTKLTLLLALAASAAAHAEKPNFNGFKPAVNAPVPRSAPSVSGGGSSRPFNAGQVIGIARSVLPLIVNANQPSQRPSPAVNTNKPAARASTHTTPRGSVTRHTVSNAPVGMDSKLAADLKAGREIASGLQSLDSLRASLGAVQEFGDVFHQPGNPGRGDASGLTNPFNEDREYGSTPGLPAGVDPSRRRGGSSSGLRDIRGDMKNSRRAGAEDTSGDWNLGPNEYMHRDGSRHRTSGSEHQGSIQHYNPDGKYSGRTDWSSNRSGDHTTAQHFDSDGQHTSTVVVERLRDGTERKTVYREGQEAVITHSDDPAPAKPGTQSCDRNPSEGASLGGSKGPSVGDVTGLMPIDLLRQFAEGNPASGGMPTTYTVTRHSGANQVRPVGEGQQTGITTRAKPRVLTGQGLEGGGHGGTDGGSGPDY